MASGTGGQIALIKQASLYSTTDSVTQWTNFVSETLEHTIGELEEGAITGRRDAPPSHKGIDSAAGDIVIEPNPNAFGHFLNGAFGTLTSSVVTAPGSTGTNSGTEAGKGQYYHKFNPRQSAFSDRSFLEPYGVMVYKDVGSAFMSNGTIFTGIEIEMTAGQILKATVNCMGRQMRRIQRTSAISAFISSGGRPWVWDMVSLEVSSGLTGVTSPTGKDNFEAITLGYTLPHEGVVLLDGTKFYGEYQPNEFRRVAISGTLSFRDQAEYEAFLAYESRYMRLTAQNVNSNIWLGNPASLGGFGLGYYGLRITVPSMKFLTWSTPIQGPNRLQTQFTAKAEYNDTAGYMYQIELVNVLSGY